jgi:hypothetical protein
MSQKYKVDFATFCHAGDAHRLHKLGQLRKQVESNGYQFNKVYVIHQQCDPFDYKFPLFWDFLSMPVEVVVINDLDEILKTFAIKLTGQYASATDKAHYWKYHVVNHLAAISKTSADYIVFADNDCWMVRQPQRDHAGGMAFSWVEVGIHILEDLRDIFIVSPNDGEPERKTRRMSQQMFLTRVNKFRRADFNQPGWDGNVNVPGGPMPEYWAMLEGRMELYCQMAGMWRYVLGPEYRYYHFNRLKDDGHFETDMSKY